jgi:hypothetical protein
MQNSGIANSSTIDLVWLGNGGYALSVSPLQSEVLRASGTEPKGFHRMGAANPDFCGFREMEKLALAEIEEGVGAVVVGALAKHIQQIQQLRYRERLKLYEQKSCLECAKLRTHWAYIPTQMFEIR